jgi:ATP-dependent Clp protease ATP-binding subunit ClpA
VIGDISFTPRAKKVIELAADEARQLKHGQVGTEHLLLGLIREGAGIAIGVVESLGVSKEALRQQTLARLSDESREPTERASATLPEIGGPKGNAKGSIITCRVDSADEDAIDALVEAGIRSTRSDAAAWLIHAGIQANLDLFDKVYTTIAEIRRLREQAQAAAKELDTRRPPTQAES